MLKKSAQSLHLFIIFIYLLGDNILMGILMHFPTFSGIACIALSFVDTHGHPLQVPAQDCTRLQTSEICTLPLHPDHFEELTVVGKVHDISVSLGTGKHTTWSSRRSSHSCDVMLCQCQSLL